MAMDPTWIDLPMEIWENITSNITSSTSLRTLQLTCKKLRQLLDDPTHAKQVKWLCKCCPSPLHRVCCLPSPRGPAFVDLLLQGGMPVDTRDSSRMTPLMVAAGRGAVGSVELLLQRGAKVNARDRFARTAVMYAAAADHAQAARALVQAGARACMRDSERRTSVHVAAMHGAARTLKVLADGVGDHVLLDLRDDEGRTPMAHAAARGDLQSVKVLTEAFAMWDQRDNQGYSAFHYAAQLGSADMLREMLSMTGMEVMNGHVDRNARRSALHMAALAGHDEAVHLLVNWRVRADTLQRDSPGSTALHLASSKGHVAVMWSLLEDRFWREQLRARDNEGRTARQVAESVGQQAALELFAVFAEQVGDNGSEEEAGQAAAVAAAEEDDNVYESDDDDADEGEDEGEEEEGEEQQWAVSNADGGKAAWEVVDQRYQTDDE